jgi:hypothetical protein
MAVQYTSDHALRNKLLRFRIISPVISPVVSPVGSWVVFWVVRDLQPVTAWFSGAILTSIRFTGGGRLSPLELP